MNLNAAANAAIVTTISTQNGTAREIRWVLKDAAGIELPAPARKTIDLEGRIVKDGIRKTVKDRQNAMCRVSR